MLICWNWCCWWLFSHFYWLWWGDNFYLWSEAKRCCLVQHTGKWACLRSILFGSPTKRTILLHSTAIGWQFQVLAVDIEIYLLWHLKLNVLKCSCSLHQFGQMPTIIIVLTHKVELAFLTPRSKCSWQQQKQVQPQNFTCTTVNHILLGSNYHLDFLFFAFFHHQISIRCAQLSPTSFSTILILFAPSPTITSFSIWLFCFYVFLHWSSRWNNRWKKK